MHHSSFGQEIIVLSLRALTIDIVAEMQPRQAMIEAI